MDLTHLVAQIDEDITRLEKARAAIAAIASGTDAPKRRGRPKKAEVTKPARKKRVLSPEAKAKIAEAQKRRWAAAKKAAK